MFQSERRERIVWEKDEEREMEDNSGIRTMHNSIYVQHFYNEMKAITFYAT